MHPSPRLLVLLVAALALSAAASPAKRARSEREVPLSAFERQSLAAGEKAVPGLHAKLKSAKPRERFEAATLLAWLGGASSRLPVADALGKEKDPEAQAAMAFALEILMLDAAEPLEAPVRAQLATTLLEAVLKLIATTTETTSWTQELLARSRTIKASPLDVPEDFTLTVSGTIPRAPFLRNQGGAFAHTVSAAASHEKFREKLRDEMLTGVRLSFKASGDLASVTSDLYDGEKQQYGHPRFTAHFRRAGGTWSLLGFIPAGHYMPCNSNTCSVRPYGPLTRRVDPVYRRAFEAELTRTRNRVQPEWTDAMFRFYGGGFSLEKAALPILETHRGDPDPVIRAAIECAVHDLSEAKVNAEPVLAALRASRDEEVRLRCLYCLKGEPLPLDLALELASTSSRQDVVIEATEAIESAVQREAEEATDGDLDRMSSLANASTLSKLFGLWSRSDEKGRHRAGRSMDPLLKAGLGRRGRDPTEQEVAQLTAGLGSPPEGQSVTTARVWGDFAALATRKPYAGCTFVLVRAGGKWAELLRQCWIS